MRTTRTISKRLMFITALTTGLAATALTPSTAQAQPIGGWSSCNVAPSYDRGYRSSGFQVRISDRGFGFRLGHRVEHAAPVCRPSAPCGLDTCSTCHHDHGRLSPFERRLKQGWDAIGYNDIHTAQYIFEELIDRRPRDPRPWVGLSIADGLGNLKNKSTRDMRCAIERGVEALNDLPISPRTARQIDALLCDFEIRARRNCDVRPDLFMVAALRTIRRDFDGARKAIDDAICAGDRSVSAADLQAFVCRADRYQQVARRH